MSLRIAAAVITSLLLSACSASAPRKPAADTPASPAPAAPAAAAPAAAAPAPPPGSSNPVEAVPLEVVVNDQTTTGRVMKLRGKIVNPHAEAVDGIRMQLVFVGTGGEEGGGRVLEIQQKELNSNLKPGGSGAFRWDVESIYLGGGGSFMVVAYPAKLGGKDMPPPDHWNE